MSDATGKMWLRSSSSSNDLKVTPVCRRRTARPIACQPVPFETRDDKITRVTTYYNLNDWLAQVAR